MNMYTSEAISEIAASEPADGTLVISVMPIMETAHYLAGAKVTETAGEIELRLVRCDLGKECDVDLKATVTPGSNDPYRIEMPQTSQKIVVVFDDDVRKTVYDPS